MTTILVTGGAGYIGSHMCVALLDADYDIVVLDNLSNASMLSSRAVERITGRRFDFIEGDVRDATLLSNVFSTHNIQAVIHFAGLKSIAESVQRPSAYYDNNVIGTFCLLGAMLAAGCQTLVFSSSALVYGEPETLPISEDHPTRPTNPYGWTKLHIERMLWDYSRSDSTWRIAMLRYFNPIGAHRSGHLGECPLDPPNNLMPYVTQVAIGRREQLSIFGNDYPTRDGTGVRDYIHVTDLVNGHIAALKHLETHNVVDTYNLGRGEGYSVLEVVRAFECASGRSIPYRITHRRPGDTPEFFADSSKARERLNWRATLDLHEMCADSWRWQRKHPDGFGE